MKFSDILNPVSTLSDFAGATASNFGNWINDKLGISDLSRQKNASKELSSYNNQLNFETWQNQFAAQNARQDELLQNQGSITKQSMINAGLNPAMIQGTPTVGAVSNPSGGNTSGSSIGAGQNAMLQYAQLKLQTDLTEAEINLKNAQAKEASSHAENLDITNTTLPQLLESMFNINQATFDKLKAETNKIAEEYSQLQMMSGTLPMLLQAQLFLMEQQGQLTNEEINLCVKNQLKVSREAERLVHLMDLDDAQANQLAVLANSIDKQTTFDEWQRGVQRSLGDDMAKESQFQSYLRSYYQNYHDYISSYGHISGVPAFASAIDKVINNNDIIPHNK